MSFYWHKDSFSRSAFILMTSLCVHGHYYWRCADKYHLQWPCIPGFKEKFVDKQTLPNSTIKCIVERFEVYFHLEDGPHNRRPMMRTEEKREEVRPQIVARSCISVYNLAQRVLTLSCMRVYCSLKNVHIRLCHVQTKWIKIDRPSEKSKFLLLVFEIYTSWNECTGQHFFHRQNMGA